MTVIPTKKGVLDSLEKALKADFPLLEVTRGPGGLGLVEPGEHSNGWSIGVASTSKLIEAQYRAQEKKQNAAAKRAAAGAGKSAARKPAVKKPTKRK